MSTRKNVIRVGDTVEVVNCRIVKRVGYPLVWTEIVDDLRKDPRVLAAFDFLSTKDGSLRDLAQKLESADPGKFFSQEPREVPPYFAMAAAKVRVEAEGFGGKERSIHYKPLVKYGELHDGNTHAADITGRAYKVTAKKLAKTGTRVPPSGGTTWTQDGPDDWYEPGGLENCKTHVLLELTHQYWIEACNVKKVDPQ